MSRGGGPKATKRGLLLSFAVFPVSIALSPLPASLFTPRPSFQGASPERSLPWTVLLAGDADGRLAPCGCTSPQEGGMKRRATALRHNGERHILLDNGGLGDLGGRQGVMKAETAAQALETAGVDAANLTARDAALGQNLVLQLARLSGGRLVSSSLRPSGTAPVSPWREAGPFLIGGATDRPEAMARDLEERTMAPAETAHRLTVEAAAQGLTPLLLFDGSRDAARALARAEPALRLVTYRATGRPPAALETEGACAIATPGERGKGIVRLSWTGEGFVSSLYQPLGPAVKDDPEVAKLYDAYLRRVARSDLLEKSPHVTSAERKRYAGSARCASCHAEATKIWKASAHGHALATLEKVRHDRDPDCVRCHVVSEGPQLVFTSRRATLNLADVGCESCHGPAAKHASSPKRIRLPKVGAKPCRVCHDPENSPHFEFESYWAKIRHR